MIEIACSDRQLWSPIHFVFAFYPDLRLDGLYYSLIASCVMFLFRVLYAVEPLVIPIVEEADENETQTSTNFIHQPRVWNAT